ncbi:genome maintenance-related protein [Trichosporon asahii var. asahii CBS 8904]|uniref:Genome maintenance-related protein n=2 Tax=Trichosporon asahii var. asahii TaxID=189963 RepID=K1VVX9_TRIAC|nr:genome maintenance-related protein [Trichosporon asahii var. asahii CBS 2479]EJT47124.1 genome maintenance-related protein [Trichosporon asahii var. asahii CBS 2479]EKD03607.1 genome maintenance-related protein [Trichosporon asahii var. asahii CBS 8904]
MSSERIANATPGAPTAPSFLSNAILSNGFVYCSGQLGQTPDGKMVEGPIGKRVDQIMDNLEAVLKAHGSSLAHTVKFNIYIIDYKDFAEINEHYIRRMPTPAPARSCIGVANLPRGTDVEIECVAVVPKPGAKL